MAKGTGFQTFFALGGDCGMAADAMETERSKAAITIAGRFVRNGFIVIRNSKFTMHQEARQASRL